MIPKNSFPAWTVSKWQIGLVPIFRNCLTFPHLGSAWNPWPGPRPLLEQGVKDDTVDLPLVNSGVVRHQVHPQKLYLLLVGWQARGHVGEGQEHRVADEAKLSREGQAGPFRSVLRYSLRWPKRLSSKESPLSELRSDYSG